MSQNPPEQRDSDDRAQSLNQEIEELYEEVEDLHRETATLVGLLAGGYAYFLQRLMRGHDQQTGLSATACEQVVLDALKRIQSSQERLDYDLLAEVQAVFKKMSQPIPLEPYLDKISSRQDG